MNLTPLPHHTRRIYLLGQLRIETERKPIALRGGKIRGLFAYLVLYPRRQHSREFLADLLWPDAPFGRARRNFSDALYRLRQRLGPDWLLVERESVGLNVTAALWTDVWAFEEGVKNRETAALTQAVALYADDLLPEIYDDWILERRLALREAYLNSLLRLGQTFERQNEPETAHNYFHRLAHADPLREEAHRGLMRALASQGRLPDALTAYDNLERLLSVELDVPPNPESQALAEQLRGELALAQKASALPRQQLVERPFVGRIQERAAILTAVEAAAAGQGGVIAIEGEAGMGKSRLLQEIQPSAQWRNVALALGQAIARPSASPYAPLRRALADTLTSPRAAQLETVLPPETLAACSPLHPPWRDLAALPDLPPERSRQRFHRAFVAVWVALADFAPHLLILDDLHWADAALWDALDALVAALRQRRLLLILAYRRLDIERAAAWELLQKWERESHLAVISLKPLTENDIAQLLPPNLQAEAPRVLASAGGSPFLISEMLIALADGHTPYRRTAVDRAAALPPPARAALETAAVLGREIPYRLWARITNLPPITLAQVSETLVKHYLLTPTPVGYAFVHDLIQNAVYKNIKPTHRVRLHQRAADALAAQDAENHPARAFHLDRANAVTEAAVMYRQAAAQEQAEYAFASAQNAFDRALTLMPPTPTIERMETLLALAQVCQVTGDRERQKTTLDEALQSVAQLGNDALRLQTLIQIGEFAATTSAQAEATTYLNEALSLAQATADQSAQMETLLVLGNLAIRYGQYKEAQTHLETALALAQKLGKRRQEGRALDGLGYVMMHIGNDAQLTISYFEQALAVQRAAGDKFGESRTLSNLLGACQNMGAWDKVLAMVDEVLAAQEAVSYRLGTAVARQAQGLAACMLGDFSAAQQALALARNGFNEVGVQLGVGIATNALGLVAERQGNAAEAENYYQEAMVIAQTGEAPNFIAFAQQDLGWLYLQTGQARKAIPLLETAAAVWEPQGDKLNHLRCQASLGLALLEADDPATAKTLAETSWAAFQQAIPTGEEPQIWLWMLYRLLTAVARPDEANHVLRAAYQELQRQSQAIADDEMRRRFFARVPLHRQIVAAHDNLTANIRYIRVTLAAIDAPLGRPLTSEEMVSVRWTIRAPEDATISGKAARRRRRLRRLLAEAKEQGAAPTDNDLAQALGVSRRTILRDMERLVKTGIIPPTRRRR